MSALLLLVLFGFSPWLSARDPDNQIRVFLPKHRLVASELAVIVNDADPLSIKISHYYQRIRSIPAANMIHIRFEPGQQKLSPRLFKTLREQVLAQTGENIQALALTWALPYRVDCMSITAAFALGFDRAYCSAKTCAATRPSPYYNSRSVAPYRDHHLLPGMAIAAMDFKHARQLIDRGLSSDHTQPAGTAYLVSTSDKNRNVRAYNFEKIKDYFSRSLKIEIIKANYLKNRHDVLFYFTGRAKVQALNTLDFLPGAIADHLTSAGGVLDGHSQMSSLRWLEAGATGSYGTVVEPCNHLGKFPNPAIVMDVYTHGSTLIEAYWKSVQQPGEGIFIGEPLAAPFDGQQTKVEKDRVILKTRTLRPGLYRVFNAPDVTGPYTAWKKLLKVHPHQRTFSLRRTDRPVYKIQPVEAGTQPVFDRP